MAEYLANLVGQEIRGYAIENENKLYLIFTDITILIEPLDGGLFKISKIDKYQKEYTYFNNNNKLISVHDLIDNLQPPKEHKTLGPYFTLSHYVILSDRYFGLNSHVYDTNNPRVVSTLWNITYLDDDEQPYQYKPSEYRWHAFNNQDNCN